MSLAVTDPSLSMMICRMWSGSRGRAVPTSQRRTVRGSTGGDRASASHSGVFPFESSHSLMRMSHVLVAVISTVNGQKSSGHIVSQVARDMR